MASYSSLERREGKQDWEIKSDDSGNGSGTGFVAGSRTSALGLVTGGSRYKAVVTDSEGDDQGDSEVQPFEVELLSDVEGASDKKRPGDGGEEGEGGGGAPSKNDRWMRDIWSVQNRAVVMSYFCVGFAIRFLTAPTSYYIVHVLDATPAQQNVMFTLASLPWSFKLVYGFISDNFPIWGMRRKPYFVAGWLSYVLINLYTATKHTPSIQLLSVVALTSSSGFMLSDVTTDAILVERSKHEPRETRGSMQAIGYSVRFVGSLVGSVMGLLLYNKEKWGWGLTIQQLFFLNAMFPVVFMGPWVSSLRETAVVTGSIPVKQRLREQCSDVFHALSQKAVYGPMAVIFTYNLFQVPNAAWRSFLVQGLSFSAFELGILAVIGSLMASLGLLVYKKWFFHSSWRKLYVWTTLVITFFSAFQILLILRVNKYFGISDLVFSIGDDSMYDLVQSIQFLPVVQMYISMCPDGAEGTTYAILTTMSNVSMAAAQNLGTMFTGIWNVGNEALCHQEFSGIMKLTLLTSLIQPLPLVLIRRLPSSQAEQQALQSSGIRNRWGGIALLTVLFGSLLWTMVLSIIELSAEGGEDAEATVSGSSNSTVCEVG